MQELKTAGVPLDGIGLQMHISTQGGPNPADVSANIARLGALGLEVHITEMDVKCPSPCDQNAQAKVYGDILQACLNNTNCKSFETWGITDKVSRCACAKRAVSVYCTPARADPRASALAFLLLVCFETSCSHAPLCSPDPSLSPLRPPQYSWLPDSDSPLLWDNNYNKKPAYYEVLATLQAAAAK